MRQSRCEKNHEHELNRKNYSFAYKNGKKNSVIFKRNIFYSGLNSCLFLATRARMIQFPFSHLYVFSFFPEFFNKSHGVVVNAIVFIQTLFILYQNNCSDEYRYGFVMVPWLLKDSFYPNTRIYALSIPCIVYSCLFVEIHTFSLYVFAPNSSTVTAAISIAISSCHRYFVATN